MLIFLSATIISFNDENVRVVQATCDPSNPLPTLTFSVRALYTLSMSCFDKTALQDVVRWAVCPPDPAKDPVPIKSNPASPAKKLPVR